MGLFKRKRPRTVIEPAKTAPPQRGCADLALGNVQGIGIRQEQEDSFAFSGATGATGSMKDGLFAVVADGMGGLEHGRACSEAAVEGLCALYAKLGGTPEPEALRSGVEELNRALHQHFGGRSGTTAAAVFLQNGGVSWISVGDSAVFLRRGAGLYQLNCAQNQRNALYIQALSREPMEPEPARQDPDAPRLRAFLGMPSTPELDYSRRPLPLQLGDVLLLCSDGVSGVLSEQELLQVLSLPPADGCGLLEDMIVNKHNSCQDNYTGILIAYTGGETGHEE